MPVLVKVIMIIIIITTILIIIIVIIIVIIIIIMVTLRAFFVKLPVKAVKFQNVFTMIILRLDKEKKKRKVLPLISILRNFS